MSKARMPLLKPSERAARDPNERLPETPNYLRPGDYVQMPGHFGIVEEIAFGTNQRRKIRLRGERQFIDELLIINRHNWQRGCGGCE